MVSALSRLPNGTIELTITLPWTKIKADYDQALADLAKTAQVKGFRQGKAPAKIVEQNIDQAELYQHTLQKIIPDVYAQAVGEQAIKPVLPPEITLIKAEKGQDWQIVARTCELPKIKLGDYREIARQALAADKIWTPGKTENPDGEPSEASKRESQISKLLASLVAQIEFNLPQILVSQEVNRMLSRLLDQVNQLGLTVEQYLASSGRTQAQLRQEYEKQAQETLKLELILAGIADEEKINVADEEIVKMIAAVPDSKAQQDLSSSTQKEYVRQLLRKRKVIDKLLSL